MIFDFNKQKTHIVLFLYWFVLVVWQNIAKQQARSSVDLVIKLALIVMLVYHYLSKSKSLNRNNAFIYIVIVLSVISTFSMDKDFSLNSLIPYVFPTLFVFLSYGVGGRIEVSLQQYLKYIHLVIYVVLYMVFYSFIFCRSHFTNIGSLATAYGNELSSFLQSNLEYGMYLTFAIIGCLICLHYEKCSISRKIFYYVSILLFLVNLLFSFSRTSIIASLFVILVYAISANKRTIPLIGTLSVVAFLSYKYITVVNRFVSGIVFKNGTASGRDSMIRAAWEYYSSEPAINQLFGLGYSNGGSIIRMLTNHGSLHNGFIQLLFINGLFGLLIVVIFLFYNIFISFRVFKHDIFLGGVFLALSCLPIIFMMTCTAIIFNSSIDSAMLTIFTIIIPRYVKNWIYKEKT